MPPSHAASAPPTTASLLSMLEASATTFDPRPNMKT
eukprot:CAMPEP_0170158608 /NCGR_PEP_ID=MMETSP0033_2-20121228/68681_1 /TAXON_ID=195969 /ORGANISM="Dolichomastix tenuilepis, Strain CCMP3274" /LENGTH=35 /DNA_ID= /DNA_START= /DNA_END= /DNA_ORIENTATION=